MTTDATPRLGAKNGGEPGQPEDVPLYRFWQPRFWPLWLGIGLLRLLVMLPYRAQRRIGGVLGRLAFAIAPRRKRIAAVNLALCFPEYSADERRRILRAHIESIGFSVFEIGLALWAGERRLARLVKIEGHEHLLAPLAEGTGVVILSAHLPAVELIGRAARSRYPASGAMYRPLKNPLVDALLRRARGRSMRYLIPKDGVRQMIRLLRKGIPVWYAADQSYDRVNAELVPFFGEPAMTNASLTHIARVGKARVVPFLQRRLPGGAGYEAVLMPALEDFPTDDPAADALRVNRLLEDWIRQAPEQYYWVHRRFKNRPAPLPDPYRDC